MKYINQPVIKKDAYALLSGKPVYTDDLAPADCLVIKLLRSPHAPHMQYTSNDLFCFSHLQLFLYSAVGKYSGTSHIRCRIFYKMQSVDPD